MGVEQFLAALGSADHKERGKHNADQADCLANLRPLARLIAKRVRELRLAKGWSSSRLGREAGLSFNTAIRAERGGRIPLRRNLARLAAALGVGVEDLTTE